MQSLSERGRDTRDTQTIAAPGVGKSHAELLLAADYLDDIEKVRIATENRIRAMRESKGITGTVADEEWTAQLAMIDQMEKFAIRKLERAMVAHPCGEYVRNTVGLGSKQAARLLAATGDMVSYVDQETGAVVERTPSMLWAYCGFVPGMRRRKGVKGTWNATAKMRAYLCAESCIKLTGENGRPRSPFRDVYDEERAKWADRDTSDGHKHAHALRVVAKRVLLELWRESRRQAGLSYAKHSTERAPGRFHRDDR